MRSLNSSILEWPDRRTVDAAVREWAAGIRRAHPDVARVGYTGSYAHGDWGVRSDVDLLVIAADASESFGNRPARFDATRLPVPADVLVYTTEEWRRMLAEGFRFGLDAEAHGVWVL